MKAVTEIAQQLKWSSNLENILSLNLPRSTDIYIVYVNSINSWYENNKYWDIVKHTFLIK